ncbi:phosphate regulon sensor histidine kinase PhoR [Desulfatiferula olefinivorans]
MKTRKRLLRQLYPSYLFITLVALLAVSLFTLTSVSSFFHQQYAQDLEARANLFTGRIAGLIESGDYAGVNAACKASGREADTRLTVVLPTGQVIGDTMEDPAVMDRHDDRPEIIQALSGKTGTSVRFSGTLNQNMMYVAVPVWSGKDIPAALRASVPLSSIASEVRRIRWSIITVGVFTALLAALVSLFVSRRVTRPVEEMTEGVRHFERGDLKYRLFVPDSLELAGLAEAMNTMAGRLDERIKNETIQKNKLEAVLSGMAEGVMAVDGDETLISINDAAARFFRADAQTCPGRALSEIVRNIGFLDLVKRAVDLQDYGEEDVAFDGAGHRTLHVRTACLLDDENRRAGTLIVFTDVTQLRRLETMRRDFAANVSHEIKTPLTAIRGFVETLMTDGQMPSDKQRHFLGIIEKNVNRLMAIIEDLLTLSRIETDHPDDLFLTRTPLYPVLETAAAAVKTQAETKGVRIEITADRDLSAPMDRLMIEQAVINLLDNAVKYCRPDSTVTVCAERIDQRAAIRVADTGPGIERRHLPRLFERFYRTDQARSRQLGGTGLGLAIVKHIMLAHKGDAAVESTVGRGSVFTLTLPA